MDRSSKALTDLEAFQPLIDDPDVFNLTTGGFNIHRRTADGKSFEILGNFGRDFRGDTDADDITSPADVLYVDYIDATRGYHIGTAALAYVLRAAQERGFHIARASIINPRIIGMISHLERLGIILDSYYVLDTDPNPFALATPAVRFHEQPNLVTSEVARTFLDDVETAAATAIARGEDPEPHAVEWVGWF